MKHLKTFALLTTGILFSYPSLAHAVENYGYASVYPSRNSAVGFNSTGGEITVTNVNLEEGFSTVVFEGLNDSRFGGHVQVSSIGFSNSYCTIRSWVPAGDDVRVSVGCSDDNGNPASSFANRYNVLFLADNEGTSNLSYLWASRPTAVEPYAPVNTFAFNAERGNAQIRRTDEGTYSVTIPGMGFGSGSRPNVQVSSYSPGGNDYCRLNNYYFPEDNLEAEVVCFDGSGEPTDSRFTLLATLPGSILGHMAYAFSLSSGEDISIPAISSGRNTFNTNSGDISSDTGEQVFISPFPIYGVSRAGASFITGHGFVFGSGFDDSASWCRIQQESPQRDLVARSSSLIVEPICVNSDGISTNQAYSLLSVAGIREPVEPIDREIRISIVRLRAESEDACGGRLDFYSNLSLTAAGRTFQRKTDVHEGNLIRPVNWSISAPLPAGQQRFSASIEVMDDDDFFCGGGDDVVDIYPAPDAEALNLSFDLATGVVSDSVGPIGTFPGQLTFRGDGGRERAQATIFVGVEPR